MSPAFFPKNFAGFPEGFLATNGDFTLAGE